MNKKGKSRSNRFQEKGGSFVYYNDTCSGMNRSGLTRKYQEFIYDHFNKRQKIELLGFADYVLARAISITKSVGKSVDNKFGYVRTIAHSICQRENKMYNDKIVQKFKDNQ